MMTEQMLARIRLLSDETLYKEATELMHSIGAANSLPSAQINGLLNVSLANTYERLLEFVQHQRDRTTWNKRESFIPDFYRKLLIKLQDIVKTHMLFVVQQAELNAEEREQIKTLLAREFIQHLLAENGYMALQARNYGAQYNQHNQHNQSRPQGGRDTRDNRNNWQNRGFQNNRENRGGYQR